MSEESKGINEYQPGETLKRRMVVMDKEAVKGYSGGNYFFGLNVRDSTGKIDLKYWGGPEQDRVQELFESIAIDQVVDIEGTVNQKGKFPKSIAVNPTRGGKLIPVPEEDYDAAEFIPVSEKDVMVMIGELDGLIESVSNQGIKAVLQNTLSEGEIREAFVKSPGAMLKHHGWMYGLLEHSLTCAKICDDIARHRPELDRDLLVAGALLHDIGKIKELETSTQIKYSEAGNFIGHIVLGAQMLEEKLRLLDVPEELKLKLLHIVISHHGKEEYGSPKTPCFAEAMVISYVDEMDARITQALKETKEAKEGKTGGKFHYSRDLGKLYLGED